MKFILFNVIENKKDIIKKICLDSKNYVYELNLSLEKLSKRVNSTKSKGLKLKNVFYDKMLRRKILKLLEKEHGKWQYILANSIQADLRKYLSIFLEEILGSEVKYKNELDKNIFKYIDEYVASNNIKKQEINALIVATENNSIDCVLLLDLIKELKNVNIYLKEKPAPYLLKKINSINKTEGTTMDIINKDKKALKEYNVIYFVDSYKKEWPRFRINKSTLILDNNTKNEDKYNSYLIKFNEYKECSEVVQSSIEYLCNQYNNLALANVICKVVFAY